MMYKIFFFVQWFKMKNLLSCYYLYSSHWNCLIRWLLYCKNHFLIKMKQCINIIKTYVNYVYIHLILFRGFYLFDNVGVNGVSFFYGWKKCRVSNSGLDNSYFFFLLIHTFHFFFLFSNQSFRIWLKVNFLFLIADHFFFNNTSWYNVYFLKLFMAESQISVYY